MLRVLKNYARQNINTHFRSRDIVFKSKASKVFDMDDEEQSAEYFYWTEMFGFIGDVTANVKVGDRL